MKFSFKSKKKTPERQPPGTKSTDLSIERVGALWFICSILFVGGATYFLFQSLAAQQGTSHQQNTELRAKYLGSQVEVFLQEYSAVVKTQANDGDLASLVVNNDNLGLKEKEQVIRKLLPKALRVIILQSGRGEDFLGDFPKLSFADLEMLAASEQTGKPPSIEAHLLGSPDAHFDIVQPLHDVRGKVIGSIMVSFAAGEIQSILEKLELDDNYIQIHQGQSADKAPVVLAALGNQFMGGATNVPQIPVTGTRWTLAFWQGDKGEGGPTMQYLFWVMAVLLLLLGLMTFLLTRMLAEAVHSDTKALINLVRDVWQTKRTGRQYPVRLSNFQGVIDVLSGMGQGIPFEDSDDLAEEVSVDSKRGIDNLGELGSEILPGDELEVVSPSIFKAYDIRGIVGDTLTEEIVYDIGRAIGSEAYARGQQSVIVARDGRLSGPEFSAALSQGLRDTGRDVIDIGMAPTPLLYFATNYLSTGTGVMVTGSHNPSDYNGFKIVIRGETLSGQSIQQLRKRIVNEDFQSGKGDLQTVDVVSDYIERVIGDVALKRPMKVVVDCGNGVTGEIAPRLLRALGCDVVELYCTVDGNFPNHHPDPSQPENLSKLIEKVRDQQADLGMAFDGDGDRLGIVDAKGTIIWPDRQMMLFATDVLSRNPGAEIIFDIKCTRNLGRVITEQGGKPLMWKTGHSLVKAKMKESGALLAGEMSGHIFFKERWYGFDDALYAGARLLEILTQDTRPTNEVFSELPNAVCTPELKVDVKEGEQFALMKRFLNEAQFAGASVITIDGLRADFEDGWGLVRASNTTPSLVLRFEGNTQQALKRIQEDFRTALLRLDPDLLLPF